MRCPACGEENPERAKFCLECGAGLSASEPGQSRDSRESRRTVTVVFADMVGFTSLGESLDQESLRRVMDRFYAEMRGAIEAQDGTLAKFIGDAVLAVWGTPEVREDDALRAVRAADAMRLALAGLNEDLHERWGVRVGMRTGVNTGEVVVDPDRPADLLVGDTLNVAARLEQAAADGEVLVGPETYRLVRDDTVLEPVEPLALKGKAKPMPAWRVVSTTREDHRGRDRLQAPLVGRESELAVLRAALDDTMVARACRMITVIGSPGLGKTRLVAEFVRSVGDEAVVLHGRCQATGEGITFQPVAEVLRGAAAIEDDDAPEAARGKLAAMLPASEPDRERIVERAAGLLGLGPVASTEETFWAVRRVLEALASERPVVLVHDDIHWGQPTFLDLLEHFTEWIRDAPVLVVALARPELREVRPALAEGALALEPLDAEASRAMVSGLLGAADLPEGLALRVLETTEGNPLFLGEMLRMLADEGVLRRDGDTWVAGNLTDVTVPPTISALLSARIQRLDPDERSVVERAAVIGHAFYRGAVAELAPPPVREHVDEALVTLGRKEMVRREDEWWLDEQVFRFHHVLIRDAAYRSLLKEARAELHERFAAWLEAKAGELAGEHEEVIAFHLEQAHAYRLELGTLDAAGRDLAARAGRRLHSAGRRALAREDLPAAINLLRRALAPLEDDLRVRQEVLVDLCEALLSAGDTGAAEPIVEELGLGAEELDDPRLQARALVFALQLDNLTGAGHLREAADAAAQAAVTLAAQDDRAGEAKAHQVVAQAEALLGQVAAAESALDRALVAARAADDRRRITAVLSGAPRAALWGPAPIVRASGRCLDVVRILRMTPGNRHVEAAALRSQAVLEAMRGRADAARGILDSCRVTLEELGLTLELRETAVHAGIVELLAGDAVAADAHLRAAHEGFRALGIESGAAQAAALLSRALLVQGRDEEALEATCFAEEHGGEDLKTTAAWLGVRAELLARGGEHDAAREMARRAVAMTEPTDALADRADALMALAAVEDRGGDVPAARSAAAAARDLYAAKDHTVGVERAQAVAGGQEPAAAPATVEPARPEPPAGGESPSARRRRLYLEAHVKRDFAAMESLFAEDFQQVDTRQMGWEPWGREKLIANVRSVAGIDANYEVVSETLADAGAVRCDVIRFRGSTPEGAMFEYAFGLVEIGGERALYSEVWDAEDHGSMLARVKELRPLAPTATSGRSPEITYARMTQAHNARDWEGVGALLAPDVVTDDRRQVGWEPWRGIDDALEFLRSTVVLSPDVVSRIDSVVARSERVIALRSTNTGHAANFGAEFTIALGQIATLDEEGRLEHIEFHDHADEEGLRRRFAELTGGAEPLAATLAHRWAEVFNARDWDEAAALQVPEFVLEDRRPFGSGVTAGSENVLALSRAMVEMAPDITWTTAPVEATDHAAICDNTFDGRSRDGGDLSLRTFVVFVASGERLARRVVFDHDQRDEAFAEYRAWATAALRAETAPAESDPWTAVHAEHVRRYAELFTGGAVERAVADLCSRRLRFRDHRPLAPMGPLDYDGYLEHMQSMGTFLDLQEATLVVVESAGPLRLARSLVRGLAQPEGLPLEVQTWYVTALDDERRIAETHLFANEADAREWWPHQVAVHAAARAYNAHDPRAVRALLHDDFLQEDLRPASVAPPAGPDAFVATLAEGGELAPDVRVEIELLAVAGDRRAIRLRWSGTLAAGGGEMEIEIYPVSVIRDGLMWRSHMYATEEEALAALGDPTAHASSAEDPVRPSADARPSVVARACAAVERAFNEGDWDAFEGVLRDDYRWFDLRSGLRAETHSRGEFVAMLRGMREGTDLRWSQTHLDERADGTVGMARVVQTGTYRGGPYEIPFLVINAIDEEGRSYFGEVYGDEDPEAARRLDELAAHHGRANRIQGAINRRDFDALKALLAEDYRQVERRPIGAEPITSRADFLDMLSRLVDMVPDVRVRMDVVAVAGGRCVIRSRWSGHAGDGGGAMEMVLYDVLKEIRDGRILVDEVHATEEDARRALDEDAATYAEDDPAALVRLEELAAEHGPAPAGARVEELAAHPGLADGRRRPTGAAPISQSYATLARAFNARDWAACEKPVAPGFRWVDHRPGHVDTEGDRAAFLRIMQAVAVNSDVRWTYEPVEGSARALLVRARFAGTYRGGPFAIVMLGVLAAGADGLLTSLELFPEDGEPEARARFGELTAQQGE